MKHSSVKQHIINTASELFYRNGYNLTGINEIIAESEIAKATLYNHFKSKEDICLAYLQYMQGGFIKDLTAHLEAQTLSEERLLAIFDFAGQLFADKGFNGCWCLNTLAEIPRDDKRIRAEIQRQKRELLELLKEQVKLTLPKLKKSERDRLAQQIYVLYEGAVGESHLHQEKWPIIASKLICQKLLA